MTPTEQKAFDLMRDAVERLQKRLVTKCQEQLVTFSFVDVDLLNAAAEALTAANAVSAEQWKTALEVAGQHLDTFYKDPRGDAAGAALDSIEISLAQPEQVRSVAYGDIAQRRGKLVGAKWQFDDLGLNLFVGEVLGRTHPPLQPKSSWQPLETAPKNATILVGATDCSVSIAYWGHPINAMNHDYCWCDESDFAITWATHWMRLPDAPKD